MAGCERRLRLQWGDWEDCRDEWCSAWALCSRFAALKPGSWGSGDKATMSQAGLLSQLIYSAAAEVCFPGCNPLLAAAQTSALGLIAPWQAGPGLPPVWTMPRGGTTAPRAGSASPALPQFPSPPVPAGNSHPCDYYPCKAPFLSSCMAQVWIARGSQSARAAASACQKYNPFYWPNERNENINSTKAQISVNKALASSHNCQTFRVSLPMSECSFRSRSRGCAGTSAGACPGRGTGSCWRTSCTDTPLPLHPPAPLGEHGLPSEIEDHH